MSTPTEDLNMILTHMWWSNFWYTALENAPILGQETKETLAKISDEYDYSKSRIAVLQSQLAAANKRVKALEAAGQDLVTAETMYRLAHDTSGAQSHESGFWWDRMRKNGDKLTALLSPVPAPQAETTCPMCQVRAAAKAVMEQSESLPEINSDLYDAAITDLYNQAETVYHLFAHSFDEGDEHDTR